MGVDDELSTDLALRLADELLSEPGGVIEPPALSDEWLGILMKDATRFVSGSGGYELLVIMAHWAHYERHGAGEVPTHCAVQAWVATYAPRLIAESRRRGSRRSLTNVVWSTKV